MRRFAVVCALFICTIGLRAAEPAAAEPTPKYLLRLYSTLQLDQRFAEKRQQYLDFMRHQDSSPGYDKVVSIIGDELIFANYRQRICDFLGTQFSESDATAIIAFLATPGGRKEYEEMRELTGKAERSPAGTVNIDAERDTFFRSLSDDERKTIDTFSATEAGQHFWARIERVDEKLGSILSDLTREIIEKHSPGATTGVKSAEPTKR